jgi:hypothetical protein
MDEPIPEMVRPEIRRCAVCGERASFGFGPPGGTALDADAWYCGTHRERASDCGRRDIDRPAASATHCFRR